MVLKSKHKAMIDMCAAQQQELNRVHGAIDDRLQAMGNLQSRLQAHVSQLEDLQSILDNM